MNNGRYIFCRSYRRITNCNNFSTFRFDIPMDEQENINPFRLTNRSPGKRIITSIDNNEVYRATE